MSFNFGTPKTASGFTLPTSIATPITTPTGAAGDLKLQTKPATGLFNTPTTTPSFSLATTTASTGFSFGATPATSTPSFSLAAVTTPSTTTQFSLGAALSTTTSASTFTPIFGTSVSTAATTATPLKLTTTTAATTFSLASTATTTAPSSSTLTSTSITSLATTSTATTSAPTITTTTTSALPQSSGLTYGQLEDNINKWTIDLEEQGKFFINQAKQLNAWDSLLVSNSEKILVLNETIERIKQDQKQLDQELDFVLAQQNELDELSTSLEKQLADVPISDQNRYQTYQLSEIIDSQLKQMSEDLKEIVEHLNESNKNEDISDPVVQISRILNAHNSSLQWIDRNTAQISSHLEQVEQLHQTYKKNHFNL